MYYKDKMIEKIIEKVKECAEDVYNELGGDWQEKIYQSAMEVALRLEGISYENQRVLPIDYKGYIVGESVPDLIVWTYKNNKRYAIVVELKQDQYIKEDHEKQLKKYMRALKKQLRHNEEIWNEGIILNFPKGRSKKIEEGVQTYGKIQVLIVKEDIEQLT